MGEPEDQENGKLRAQRLRKQIEELRRGTLPSRPSTPRELTDDAAREESHEKASEQES